MRYRRYLTGLAALGVLVAAGTASAVVVSVDNMATSTSGGYSNVLSLEIEAVGLATDSDTSTVTGNIPIHLDATFNPITQVASVTGISFIPQAPGAGLSFTDMDFHLVVVPIIAEQTIDMSGVKGTLDTPTYPPTLGSVTGVSFPVTSHQFILNDGTITGSGITSLNMGLAEGEDPGPSTADMVGPNGSITVSTPSIVNNVATYNTDLVLPVQFSQTITTIDVLGTPVDVNANADGTVHAVGSFSRVIPEPGTLAMFLGLAASLAGYGLWRRCG